MKTSEDRARIIREPECGERTGLSRTTRWRLERAGKFPKRRQLTECTVGWLLGDILDWIDSRQTVRRDAA